MHFHSSNAFNPRAYQYFYSIGKCKHEMFIKLLYYRMEIGSTNRRLSQLISI